MREMRWFFRSPPDTAVAFISCINKDIRLFCFPFKNHSWRLKLKNNWFREILQSSPWNSCCLYFLRNQGIRLKFPCKNNLDLWVGDESLKRSPMPIISVDKTSRPLHFCKGKSAGCLDLGGNLRQPPLKLKVWRDPPCQWFGQIRHQEHWIFAREISEMPWFKRKMKATSVEAESLKSSCQWFR